jgi:Fe-S-cluster containining protein
MSKEKNIELEDYINTWLDQMMEVYGVILEEWEEYDVVKPVPGAHVEFNCNDCGKCCEFKNHWVWVYPSDIVKWLQNLNSNKIIPILLGILFPVQDYDDVIGYGLPSQNTIYEKFNQFIKIHKGSKQFVLRAILKILSQLNPTFNKNSDFCIFYNSKSAQHCLIYDFRPIQCQVFPLDYPQFTSIEIPENLKDKYGTYEDDLEDLPMCPIETYNGDPLKGVMVSEDERDLVAMEKANYLTSYVTKDWQDTDISEILIEIFSKEILNLVEKKTGKK